MNTSPPSGPGRLSYIYAVGRPGPGLDAVATAGTGITGGPLRTVEDSGLAAVVCDVPAEEFDEAGLRAQLEDLERLERLARAHHEVVENLAERLTVLPLRLATVYRGDDGVAAMLEGSHDAFEARLHLLKDAVEWGVKIYLRTDSASGDDEPGPPAADASASPGRDFLRRRRAQRDSRQDAHRAASEAAGQVRESAARYATAHVAHRPQEGRLATEADSGENLVNDAYLVDRTLGEEFREVVAAAARESSTVHVLVTGPWAPYSFAAPEEETHRSAASPEEQADAR